MKYCLTEYFATNLFRRWEGEKMKLHEKISEKLIESLETREVWDKMAIFKKFCEELFGFEINPSYITRFGDRLHYREYLKYEIGSSEYSLLIECILSNKPFNGNSGILTSQKDVSLGSAIADALRDVLRAEGWKEFYSIDSENDLYVKFGKDNLSISFTISD